MKLPIMIGCIGALVIPSAFYFYTCAPGIGMGDTALLIEYVHWLHLSTHAAVHNIAVLIGALFYLLPGENLAWKVNLASVFTGGAAVALFGTLLLRVLRSRLVALACTGVLAVSHSMWWHSTIAEAYAVNALFTVAVLHTLFAPGPFGNRRLVLLFLTAALALFNHTQMGVVAVGATVALLIAASGIVYGRRTDGADRPTLIKRFGQATSLMVSCTLAFLVGWIPWLLVFRKDVIEVGWRQALFDVRGAGFRSLMFQGDPIDGLTDVLYLVFEQFPGPFLLAVPVGLVLLVRRYDSKRYLAFFVMLSMNTVFFALYDTWDRYAFLLPSFIMLAFAGSLTVDSIWSRASTTETGSRRHRVSTIARGALIALLASSVIIPPWFYSRLSIWGDQPGIWRERYGSEYMENVVDFSEYRGNPNKRHWREAEIYADLLFEKLPRGATLVEDDSRAYYPLQYFRRYFHKRSDLKIFLINSWSITDWGMNNREFVTLLRNAYDQNHQLYLPSLQWPYKPVFTLTIGSGKPRFERVPLDEERYIFRLLTAKEFTHTGRKTRSSS